MSPKQLRQLLRKAKLSQSKAARLVGITDRSMRRYIAGTLPVPRAIEYALKYVVEHRLEEEK